jgi:hypothetical protein
MFVPLIQQLYLFQDLKLFRLKTVAFNVGNLIKYQNFHTSQIQFKIKTYTKKTSNPDTAKNALSSTLFCYSTMDTMRCLSIVSLCDLVERLALGGRDVMKVEGKDVEAG